MIDGDYAIEISFCCEDGVEMLDEKKWLWYCEDMFCFKMVILLSKTNIVSVISEKAEALI